MTDCFSASTRAGSCSLGNASSAGQDERHVSRGFAYSFRAGYVCSMVEMSEHGIIQSYLAFLKSDCILDDAELGSSGKTSDHHHLLIYYMIHERGNTSIAPT